MLESLLKLYARRFPLRRGKYRIIDRFGAKPDASGGFVRRARLAFGDFAMDCDLRKQLQRQFYYFGTYFLEEKVIEAWTRYARDAKVIFDVGANAGIYSLAAVAASLECQVHAFEPTPEIAGHLRTTVGMNGIADRLYVHEAAVGNRPGSIFLNSFSGYHDDNEGMNFVSTEPRAASSIQVSMLSLDAFCAERCLPRIDLMKVDVQGNEPAVFEGARGLIERGAIRTIFFELNWNRENPGQCPARNALEMLTRAGYAFADSNCRMEPRVSGPGIESLSDVIAVR
jgi:FkbM family methyltransferase